MSLLIELAEQALIPDALIRMGIRKLDRIRLDTQRRGDVEALCQDK